MGTIIRSQIDLNTCITYDEDPFAPFVASNSANVKIVIEIDLEAPILHEMEDDIIPSTHLCNVLKIKSSRYRIKLSGMREKQYLPSHHLASKFAASIQFVTCQKLLWQNQSSCSPMLSSCASELKGKDDAPIQGLPMEMDNFEAMALQLTETKEKDYMPKPLVPEVLKVEEMGATLLPSRSRRGYARRGRQRRDFQRDILPSLASLLLVKAQSHGGYSDNRRADESHWPFFEFGID